MKTTFSTLIILAVLGSLLALNNFSAEDKNQVDKHKLNTELIKNLKETNKNLNQTVSESKETQTFTDVRLFRQSGQTDARATREFVSEANFLTIDMTSLADLISSNPENMTFEIPLEDGKTVKLDLVKNDILSDNFSLSVMNGTTPSPVPYTPGLYYKGVVRGKELSTLAAISIFSDHVMGVIADEEGNWNLGPIRDSENRATGNYIYYNDFNRLEEFDFKCGLEGKEEENTFPVKDLDQKLGEHSFDNSSAVPLKVYFVADYSLYVAANGNLQTLNDYITGLFNVVSTIYQNENIPFQIAYVAAYTQPDPMSNASGTWPMRQIFGAQIQNNMQGGDIANLLSVRQDISGGLAYIRSLCNQYNPADSSGSYCVCVIQTNYNPYPTYSWTTTVVAHEMGHNTGSRHTHACVWPRPGGGVGPIDTCVITGENSTFSGFPEACVPIQPVSGCYSQANGTIMSYCHFCNSTHLGNGFGPLPGDTIRLRFTQAQNCLIGIQNISSEIPSDHALMQNYPNPFNPSTKINFNVKNQGLVKLTVYNLLGETIEKLVNETLTAGTYEYTFEAKGLPSGIYFYRLETDKFSVTKQMVLIK